jgi:hypothetical protein
LFFVWPCFLFVPATPYQSVEGFYFKGIWVTQPEQYKFKCKNADDSIHGQKRMENGRITARVLVVRSFPSPGRPSLSFYSISLKILFPLALKDKSSTILVLKCERQQSKHVDEGGKQREERLVTLNAQAKDMLKILCTANCRLTCFVHLHRPLQVLIPSVGTTTRLHDRFTGTFRRTEP